MAILLLAFVAPLQLVAAVFGLAVYAAAAMAIEDAQGSTLLPVGRRDRGASSMGGNLHEQLERLEREAGVREQL